MRIYGVSTVERWPEVAPPGALGRRLLGPDQERLAAGPEAGPLLGDKPSTGPLRADKVLSVSPRALDRRITKPSPISTAEAQHHDRTGKITGFHRKGI